MGDHAFTRTVRNEAPGRAAIQTLIAAGKPVHLIDCDLAEANLSRLDLSGWRFDGCDMRSSAFGEARLEGTYWQSCRGPFAKFVRANLAESAFVSCDFNNAIFRGGVLGSATFTGCKLTGADFTEARAIDMVLCETLLIGASLVSHSFRKQTLRCIDFEQADLRKCDFREAVLEGCSLRDANLAGARFDKADLRGTDLGGLRLVDAALFRGATISREQAAQLIAELGLRLG